MGLLDALKKTLGGGAPSPSHASGDDTRTSQEGSPVQEVTATDLMGRLRTEATGITLLLDCREESERRFAHIPDSLHIPMNSIPARLAEIDRQRDIVVYCAHGNRSYSVAGWLSQQGYRAASLRGGIAEWQARGGAVQSALRRS